MPCALMDYILVIYLEWLNDMFFTDMFSQGSPPMIAIFLETICVESQPLPHLLTDILVQTWSDDNEVEAALSTLNNKLDQTDDVLTKWSHGFGSSIMPSYLSGSMSSPSFTPTSSIYIPFKNTLWDAHILSTITERTANPSPHPMSSDTSSRPYSPHGHQRTGLVPAGPCSPCPYMQTSQSIPTFSTTTYGYSDSHPSCLVKAGYLNLNLTHLASRRAPSFPPTL